MTKKKTVASNTNLKKEELSTGKRKENFNVGPIRSYTTRTKKGDVRTSFIRLGNTDLHSGYKRGNDGLLLIPDETNEERGVRIATIQDEDARRGKMRTSDRGEVSQSRGLESDDVVGELISYLGELRSRGSTLH